MSRLTGLSATTLSRAAAGRFLPGRQVVHAYALACGGDTNHVAVLWQQAYLGRYNLNRAYNWPTPPHLVKTPGELRAAVTFLHRLSGFTYRDLEERSLANAEPGRSFGRLPRSTAHNLMTGHNVPRRETLLAFVAACGVDDEQIEIWSEAWDRIYTWGKRPAFRAGDDGELLTVWGLRVGAGQLEGQRLSLRVGRPSAGSDAGGVFEPPW